MSYDNFIFSSVKCFIFLISDQVVLHFQVQILNQSKQNNLLAWDRELTLLLVLSAL